jgi:outer membrane biosynthesis protein TonB
MNRSGDILKVKLIDSNGNKSLDESCMDAIRLSKSFGAVPEDIKGEVILIPFIFGYYTK